MWPPYFPAWLIVPALGIDALRGRLERVNPWLASAAFGVVFVALFVAVQWPFSIFMLSEGARNALFNGHEWPYTTRVGPWLTSFWGNDQRLNSVQTLGLFTRGLLIAMVWAALSSRLGLAWGGWMSRVRR
jgi:Na+/melibiose symporter-like transporter